MKLAPQNIFFLKKLTLALAYIYFAFPASAQENMGYKILVAGHSYGAHAGKNIGLHPPFLEKLKNEASGTIMALFLTGDIVNTSTTASWAQVSSELNSLGLTSYYVMGNHDNSTIGRNVFQQKHGGLYYYFAYQNDLFIVLNSTESDRSISTAQLGFLNQILSNADLKWGRAFIFFHEVIWNSNEKYRLVRSNSRSRYDLIKSVSNFWQEVFPRLTAMPDKKFYLFSGDVGGNPDAIAAFYDRWQNVTLLSSGMGEVSDENFMKVNILPDTVTFSLIPLGDGVEMHPINWYNVPEKPEKITGPERVIASGTSLLYSADPVENATSYLWSFSNGINGSGNSVSVNVNFDATFQDGKITVKAVNDGFGESDATELEIKNGNTATMAKNSLDKSLRVYQSLKAVNVWLNSDRSELGLIKIYDLSGRLLLEEPWHLTSGENVKTISGADFHPGLFLLQFISESRQISGKMVFQ